MTMSIFVVSGIIIFVNTQSLHSIPLIEEVKDDYRRWYITHDMNAGGMNMTTEARGHEMLSPNKKKNMSKLATLGRSPNQTNTQTNIFKSTFEDTTSKQTTPSRRKTIPGALSPSNPQNRT